MSLTLTLRNPEAAPEGMAPSFTLQGDSAVIGRSARCDWHLPDPSNTISSRHAEIVRTDKGYALKDTSTNGTFVNGAGGGGGGGATFSASEARISDWPIRIASPSAIR
jgi:predicted component of type VI protein secretion system